VLAIGYQVEYQFRGSVMVQMLITNAQFRGNNFKLS